MPADFAGVLHVIPDSWSRVAVGNGNASEVSSCSREEMGKPCRDFPSPRALEIAYPTTAPASARN
jgi:hypothetical protein